MTPAVAAPPPTLTPAILAAIYRVQDCFAAQAYAEAEALTRAILAQGFAEASTFHTLGTLAYRQGRAPEAIAQYRQALAVDPSYRRSHDQLIVLLDVDPETTAAAAQQERTRWWAQHGTAWSAPRHPNPRDPARPLRVGYLSGDVFRHSAELVFGPILHTHSAAVVPYCYSSTPTRVHDAVTATYRERPGWRDVADWSDDRVLAQVRADQIDVLVDLSGYTPNNRLGVIAAAAAPVQITAWGYATGLGWPAGRAPVLLADPVVCPPAVRATMPDRVVDLPCVLTYAAHRDLPPVTPLPCLTQPPTFGVFQRAMKINAADLALWRAVLARLPDSRLILKGDFSAAVAAQLASAFAATPDRVTLLGPTSQRDHLRASAAIDLSLDPFPQTGGVTTCETLTMGVPPVTLIGPRVIQRTTASLLTVLGLTDFIATTPEQYVDLAVSWVTTRKHELAALRPTLRARFQASPIVAGYVEAVEDAYRALWRAWCHA